MKYWILSFAGGVELAFRAAADPIDSDDDVVVERWDARENVWVDDDAFVDDLIWEPSLRDASAHEVSRLIEANAA